MLAGTPAAFQEGMKLIVCAIPNGRARLHLLPGLGLLSFTLMCARKRDQAERQARRVLEWEPRFGLMRSLLGLSLADGRMFPEAIQELTRAVESQRVATTLAFLAQGYAQAGRTADAE